MVEKREQPFLPVLLGGNRGTYGLARAFFERYRTRSVVVSRHQTGSISHSRIVQAVFQRDVSTPEKFRAAMEEVERAFPLVKKIIIACDDVYLDCLLENRHALSSQWVVPYARSASCRQLADKSSFYALCERAGVAYPQTVVLAGEETSVDAVRYPVILKPAVSSTYEMTLFPGKKKVYLCSDEGELLEEIRLIRQHGYGDALVVQEYIPGPDTHLSVLTVYFSSENQEVKLHSFANVLVDDPTPEGKGNSLAMYVRQDPGLLEPARRLAQLANFSGFATIDVKYDERKKTYCFLDWNPRLGSNHYYVTSSGQNVAACYGADYLGDSWVDFALEGQEQLYSLLPARLLLSRLTDPGLKQYVQKMQREGRTQHPLWAPYDRTWQRWGYIKLSQYNFYRKLGMPPFAFPSPLRQWLRKQWELVGQEG